MNKHKILAAVFGAAIVFTACKKTDVQREAAQNQVSATTTAAQWKPLNNWTSQSQEKYTVYSNTVEDKNISSAIASKGLVLAYKKTSSSVVALPTDEKGSNGSYFWYYQISDGAIVFSADAYGTAKTPGADQSFAYFIVSPEKLNELQEKGYSKAELMKLSYENAAALLK
jgi:hypothetical protein